MPITFKSSVCIECHFHVGQDWIGVVALSGRSDRGPRLPIYLWPAIPGIGPIGRPIPPSDMCIPGDIPFIMLAAWSSAGAAGAAGVVGAAGPVVIDADAAAGAAVVVDVPGSDFEHAPAKRTAANTKEREIIERGSLLGGPVWSACPVAQTPDRPHRPFTLVRTEGRETQVVRCGAFVARRRGW